MNTAHLSGAECSRYGEHEDGPDLFLWIGTTVVLVGCVFCALRALGVIA